jgi:ATP-binding cassette, subfamily B, bacterial MsbA
VIIPIEFRRLLSTVRLYRARLGLGVAFLLVAGAGNALMALMIRPILDSVLTPQSQLPGALTPLVTVSWNGYTIDLNTFFPSSIRNPWTVFAIALLVIFVAKGITEFVGTMIVQYVGLSAVTDLRNRVYAKLIRQPIGFFQHHTIGRLMSATINDVERVRIAMSEYLADFFLQIFSFVALAVVVFVVNWKMALGAMIFLPAVLMPIGKLGRLIRKSVQRSQSRLGEMNQMIQEGVAGNRVVKAFGMEGFEIDRFRDTARRLLRENLRWVSAYVLNGVLMDLLGAVLIALALLYARDQINHKLMTVGEFGTFVFAMLSAYTPLKRIGSFYQQLEQARGATAEVFEFLALGEEESEKPGAVTLPPFSRDVVLEKVSFAYEREAPVLRNIDLTARAGEVVAIVGSSGSGKTTLVNLLPRFASPVSGKIRFDGHDIEDVTLRSLREQIAIVTQENILFNDTVWNNLCYGRPGMPKEKVIAAAQAAWAHDFISEMPRGYETMLGDRGQRLSGGQRQRLAIARAILKDSPILILDEATSELDSESEMEVQKALANLMIGRTVFVIAHRLSTIRRANKIVVLDGGTICERGTHQELIGRGGLYSRLYEMQFADDDTRPQSPAEPAAVTQPESAKGIA